jgi:hypothetical protein
VIDYETFSKILDTAGRAYGLLRRHAKRPAETGSGGRGLVSPALTPKEPAQPPRPPAGFLRAARTMWEET